MKRKNIHFVLHKQTHTILAPHFIFWPHGGKKNESSVSTCLLCVTHEEAHVIHICVSVCKILLQLLLSPLRSLTFPGQLRLTAQSGYYRSPTLLHLLSFLFQSLLTLLHFLRLPLFHALSSHNTVGGAELEYLEFPWAPLSGICPLLGCWKFSSPH